MTHKDGPQTRFGVKKVKSRLLVVEGFGPPRNVAPPAHVTYPAERANAPLDPPGRESKQMTTPMVQSIPELAATGVAPGENGLTLMLLRMYERHNERQLELVNTLVDEVRAGRAETRELKELVLQVLQGQNGTQLTTVEQLQAFNARMAEMGLMPIGTNPEREQSLLELVAPLLESLKPLLMPFLQELLSRRAAAQPTNGTAQAASYRPRRPVNGDHAGAPSAGPGP
jgi:hypothetical protein